MKKVCLLVMSLVLVLALAATGLADTINFRMADNQADGTPNVEGDKKFRACAKCNTNLDEVKPAPVARKAAKAAATEEKAVKRTKKAKAEKAE